MYPYLVLFDEITDDTFDIPNTLQNDKFAGFNNGFMFAVISPRRKRTMNSMYTMSTKSVLVNALEIIGHGTLC